MSGFASPVTRTFDSANRAFGFDGTMQHKMHLASPAYLAAVSYILMALVVFAVPFDAYGEVGSESYRKLPNRILFVVSLAIPMALSVFSINCMASDSGKWCTSWSWVQAVFVMIWVATFVWMVFAHNADKKK